MTFGGSTPRGSTISLPAYLFIARRSMPWMTIKAAKRGI
jgi:hypothetical protein